MQSYESTPAGHYFKIVPIVQVLEAIQHLGNAFALSAVAEQNRSLPFDIGQIESDYNYKQDLKHKAMEIEKMKVEELSPLAKTLKYTGMGKVSNEELNQKIAEGQDTFQIGFIQKYKDAEAEAVINCTKSKTGKYYADNYDIIVKEEGKADLKRNYQFSNRIEVPSKVEGQKPEKINPTITFKEAFNQMQARGVFKTFVYVDIKEPKNNRKYEAWDYINFNQTDKNGNYKSEKFYDLEVEPKIKSLSLVENMDYENFQQLCESLKRGNIQSAKYIALDGTQEQIYLVANAKFKTINAFDKDMNPINLHEKRQLELDALEQHKLEQKQGQKQGQKVDNEQETTQQKIGKSLKV
ncbi:hypothetical protein [Sphingobacterium detergens]|uniref:Uncharacterized protein n=1 Tax=Sphingobacterium detergens TaxID=1145106 RepID=A0A420ARX4_SPHD1|nr:hypothetical protein [Sphingobacterium detergens]RKE47185.1 hypothetical protein DFQ12_4349 [Sphingobacterium detergens]